MQLTQRENRLSKGVYISTYGCQMNVNDTERMYSLLEMADYHPVKTPEEASLLIVNSCSIREKPVHKVYSEVGTFKKLKDMNPDLKIGVGGCVGQQEKEKLIKNQPLIDFVFGTDTIDQLPKIIADMNEKYGDGTGKQKAHRVVDARFQHREPYHIETMVRNPGVSTFVNITKGCDNFCTFCVVPYTRGREKSRPMDHVLKDAQNLIRRGVKEITVLGQNVNSYTSDCGADFADLLNALAEKTSIERIRYTTSHPKDFNQKLVDVMRAHQDKICEYIHLPFQSGNSRILERMNRGYTREEYLAKIKMIKQGLPHVVLSTDIIVGFPGETEEDFKETLSMVQEVGYETIFAFKYSPRPNTKAAKFEDQIPEDIKSRRLTQLFEEHNKMAFDMVKRYDGMELPVLVEELHTHEDKQEGEESGIMRATGRTTQNKLVHFLTKPLAGDRSLIGKTVPVRITKAFPAVLRGEWIQG